jgi:hypothetical protein
MSKFVVNTDGTKAINKEEVSNLEIMLTPATEDADAFYSLNIFFIQTRVHAYEFERDSTFEGIQAKATTILEALEAE